MAENYNFRFTICVIGGRRVGKTQIITRFTEDRYTGEDTFYSYLRSGNVIIHNYYVNLYVPTYVAILYECKHYLPT